MLSILKLYLINQNKKSPPLCLEGKRFTMKKAPAAAGEVIFLIMLVSVSKLYPVF